MADKDYGPLAAALAKAQAAFPPINRDREVTVALKSGGSYKFRYAPLDTIIGDTRQALAANGLAITQLIDSDPDGMPLLVTRLLHESGAYLEGHTPIPGANGGTPQEFGSAITYMRRYAITALLGVATEEDDDGNHASGNGATFKDHPRATSSQPAAPIVPVTPPPSSGPIETLTGIVTRDGTIKAGGAAGYKCESRQTPDGLHAFGFRLEIDRDKAIAQALVEGQLAEDIIDTLDGNTESLINTWAEVTGRLYHVTEPGKTSFYRLRVTAMKTKAWTLPSEAPTAAMGL